MTATAADGRFFCQEIDRNKRVLAGGVLRREIRVSPPPKTYRYLFLHRFSASGAFEQGLHLLALSAQEVRKGADYEAIMPDPAISTSAK